jgi:hypothetical protein
MRRSGALHRIFYGVGLLSLVVAAFGMHQLALLGVPLLFIGAGFHVRWRRGGDTTPAHHGTHSPGSLTMSRPGLHDRYEGIVTSLTRRRD